MKAMILAAGRGERMRPLTDHCPKPLLTVGNKPLIVWHIERLVQAGIHEIVINYAWLGHQFPQMLGDGSQWGAKLHYSPEQSALETAGGIARALPLLGEGVFLVISGDIYTDFDFASLHARATMMQSQASPLMHLILVDNPDYHPEGDFGLEKDHVVLIKPSQFRDLCTIRRTRQDQGAQHAATETYQIDRGESEYRATQRLVGAASCAEVSLTYANIGLYNTCSFAQLDPQCPAKLAPLIHQAIAHNVVSGEHYRGTWHNIGTPEQLYALDHLLKHQG